MFKNSAIKYHMIESKTFRFHEDSNFVTIEILQDK